VPPSLDDLEAELELADAEKAEGGSGPGD